DLTTPKRCLGCVLYSSLGARLKLSCPCAQEVILAIRRRRSVQRSILADVKAMTDMHLSSSTFPRSLGDWPHVMHSMCYVCRRARVDLESTGHSGHVQRGAAGRPYAGWQRLVDVSTR